VSGSWRLFSPLLVRSAGFPIDPLERLRTLDPGEAHRAIREVVADERIAEAILVSNPAAHDVGLRSYLRRFDPERRPAKARYMERQLYSYLQRLCTKNETASFFGPIDYGRFDATCPTPLAIAAAPDGALQARVSRLAHWAAQALAAAAGRDPDVRPHVAPRLRPGCRVGAEGEVVVRSSSFRMGRGAWLLADAMDGRRPASDLCRGPRDWALLDGLARSGVVVWELEVPTAVFDPLGWLQAWLTGLPPACPGRTRWLSEVAWFETTAASYAPASRSGKSVVLGELEERFRAVTGDDARRAAGAMYADRTVLNDDARGHLRSMVVGGPLGSRLRDALGPLLDLCASYAVTVQEVCRERALAALGERRSVPLIEFLAALDDAVDLDACLADDRVAAFERRLAALALPPGDSGPVALDPAALRPLSRDVPAGTMASPDVFLLAPDQASVEAGRCELVLGEVHAGAQVWTHFLLFHDDLEALERELACLLPPPDGAARACLVHRRNQGRTFPLELPGLSVEVLGRSAMPAGRVLPVADVEVCLESGELALRSRSLGLRLELYPGEPTNVASWLFGSPPVTPPRLRWDAHRPRVLVGEVVAWREAWRLPADAVAEPARAVDLRLRRGLPERCFARVAGERKPFFVDFASLPSLEHLASRARDTGQVELTEMLPAPDRWWLGRGAAVHSCEWRMTLIHG
jgi:Lantibiotic dehydratase, N terminus